MDKRIFVLDELPCAPPRAGEAPSRRGMSPVAFLLALLTMAGTVVTQGGQARAGTGNSAPLRPLGRIAAPPETESNSSPSRNDVFLIDNIHRRLYTAYAKQADGLAKYFREYDLDTPVPRFIRESRVASSEEWGAGVPPSSGRVAFDTRRDQILALDNSGAIAGCSGDLSCGSSSPAPMKLFVVDRKTLHRKDIWNIHKDVPSFFPKGITYSREDDRIYLVGVMEPGASVDPAQLVGIFPRTFPTAVAAIDPNSGKMLWLRVVPECGIALQTDFYGITIVRSALRPTIYFACIRTAVDPELSGLARMTITPTAGATDATLFPVEFYPISGAYTTGAGVSGLGLFDYGTDRFFMQSQADTTPGTWVFDGRLSAWVGFVGTPDSSDVFGGINQQTGRYYLGGRGSDKAKSYVIISDARQTEVPQGTVFRPGRDLNGFIFTDGETGRLFLNLARPKEPGISDWWVYKDELPLVERSTELDYDSLTSDIPEGPSTFSTFAGSVNGFGALVSVVGGVEGFTNLTCSQTPAPCNAFKELFRQSFNFSPSFADRGLLLAQVPSVDLRNVGASAEARALSLDQTSDGEYETLVNEAAKRAAKTAKSDAAGDAVKQMLAWPHRPAGCLDAGDGADPKPESGTGGGSTVGCDLGKDSASASTTFGAFSLGGVSIGSSSFETEALRSLTKGVVTKTTAIVKGVEISYTGLGTVAIDRVTAVATSAAHGTKGTASISWTRSFEGVSVMDAAGKVVFACAEGQPCDTNAAVAAMNSVLQTRVRVDLPKAELIASKGGAFAGLQESEGDFTNGLVANNESSRAVPAMQITVFNDGDEKSRLLIQLAGIQASSIYGISQLPQAGQLPGGEPLPLPTGGVLVPSPPVVIGGNDFVAQPTGPAFRIGQTPLFMIRSPKDAALFGLTILLLGLAVASVWRRRALIRRLEET